MTHTVEDQQRAPFAPEPHSSPRAPTLPAPPDFDDEPTRVQRAPEVPDSTLDDHAAATAEHQAGEEASASRQFAATDQLLVDEPVADELPVEDSLHAETAAATAVLATPQLSPEEQKLADERAARREAREQALAAADIRTVAAAEPIVVTRRSTDQFLGASALFLLRLVVAAIMAVRGLEIVTNLGAAEALLATTLIPEPRIMAMVIGGAALAIAVALVFGLLTRVAGLGVTLITGGALAFVLWGNWSPFVPGRPGFIGELELLLAVVGLVFLMIGGGGFSLDRSFRKSREKDRLAAQVG